MNVIFPQLVIVENSNNDCEGCYFEDDCDIDLIEKLTGVDCHIGVIFKKKREWVTCTKENTKVGNKVRLCDPLTDATMKYISCGTIFDEFDCIVNYGDKDTLHWLGAFEIEIVR